MSYSVVLKANRSLIGFGILTAFGTSFGQTFFISLFLPQFLRSFDLSEGSFGLLYAAATVTSALLLPVLGALIDRADLKRYTTLTVAGLAVSAAVVASAPNGVLLGLGLAGLRLSGQGLLGHISQTVMAKAFESGRGRALSVASLGYPLGEAILPVTFAILLSVLRWQTSWWIVAAFSLLMIFPLRWLVRGYPEQASERTAPHPDQTVRSSTADSSRRAALSQPRFYLVLFPALLAPFVLTGMFLYQIPLASSRGWAPELIAAAFAVFAAVRAFSSLAVGPLIDRFSALRLVPLFLLPLAVGLALLNVTRAPWTAFAYLALAGVTGGVAGSITSAVWAEMFGVSALGQIRSLTAGLAVLSTAASPVLIGILLSTGSRFDTIVAHAAVLLLLGSFSALFASSGRIRSRAEAFARDMVRQISTIR